NRQLIALTTFSDLVQESRNQVLSAARLAGVTGDDRPLSEGGTGPVAYADAVATYLAFGVSRSADFWCTLATWSPAAKNELVSHAFTKQAIPMTWDFAEANPFSESGGNYVGNVGFVAKVVDHSVIGVPGSVRQLDATTSANSQTHRVIATDPPYYDNIGY